MEKIEDFCLLPPFAILDCTSSGLFAFWQSFLHGEEQRWCIYVCMRGSYIHTQMFVCVCVCKECNLNMNKNSKYTEMKALLMMLFRTVKTGV